MSNRHIKKGNVILTILLQQYSARKQYYYYSVLDFLII